MKKLIILFIICFFSWINLHASTLVSDSIIAESIQKEIIECMTTINDRTDFNTDSSLRKTIKTAKRLNALVNKYYVITNDSTVFSCTFVGELITAAIYDSHKLIDSAYVHCKRACQLYEPYGRMACSADSTKQFSRMFFGNDGIYSIMRDWNVKQKKYEEAIRYGTIIIDSCQA